MRGLIRAIDGLLRRAQGIVAFSDDPDCLFRIRVRRNGRTLVCDDARIPAGERIVELHLWNERVPASHSVPSDLAWAAKGAGMLKRSLRRLARELRDSDELAGVAGVVGTMAFFSGDDAAVGGRLVRRLGFRCEPARGRLGRFGAFWENLYAWMLLATFNRNALRGRRLAAMRRFVLWMPADELVRRYAPDLQGGTQPPGTGADAAGAGVGVKP